MATCSAIVQNYNSTERRNLWPIPDIIALVASHGHMTNIWVLGRLPTLTTSERVATPPYYPFHLYLFGPSHPALWNGKANPKMHNSPSFFFSQFCTTFAKPEWLKQCHFLCSLLFTAYLPPLWTYQFSMADSDILTLTLKVFLLLVWLILGASFSHVNDHCHFFYPVNQNSTKNLNMFNKLICL